MNNPQYTSQGKTALIDLSRGRKDYFCSAKELSESFLGGRGLNAFYLYKLLEAGTDPLSPENPLIFGNGLLTGIFAPNAGRFNVTAKSPESGALGDSNCGGFFGPALRYGGFDRLILLGRAEKPSYLLIENGGVELRDARSLWGLSTRETQIALKESLGDGVEVAAIGPAGERMVRFASIMNGPKDTAGRCGLGAVMGSKNLKAIACRGEGAIPLSDPEGLLELSLDLKDYIRLSKVTEFLGSLGTPMLYGFSNRLGAIRTRNSQLNTFEDSLDGEEVKKRSLKMLACQGCLIHCRHRNDQGGEGPEYSTIGLLGANCAIDDLDQVIALGNLCNELGLDSCSAGSLLAWYFELYERGIIDEAIAGRPLRFGDPDLVRELLLLTSRREGFGDLLAESTRALSSLPPEALDYLIAVKGLPQSDPHDVRYIKSFALGIAVASRGADHLRNRPTLEVLRLPEELTREIYGGAVSQEPTSYETKEIPVKFSDDIFAAIDSLGLCKFVCHGFNSPHLLKYEHFAELIHKATGLELSAEEIRASAERIVDTERLINLREGFTRAHDTLPRRYFEEPLPLRKASGHRIEREKFEALLSRYYCLRGWDEEGVPPPSRREELEMLAELEVLAEV